MDLSIYLSLSLSLADSSFSRFVHSKLAMPFPQEVADEKGRAQWDPKIETLVITVPKKHLFWDTTS